jgi:TonB family protein
VGDSPFRYVVISAVLHGIVCAGFVGFASTRPRPTRPPIYRARIVTLPGQAGGAARLSTAPAPEPAKPKPPPTVEQKKPEPKPQPKEQIKTAKPKKETTPVPATKKDKPKPAAKEEETKGIREDRRTGGFKGKIEAPAATPTTLPGGGSGSIGVDATDFTFSYYLVTIQNKIAEKWDPPAGLTPGATLIAVIHFYIERDGRVVRAEVEVPSSIPMFDATALRAVERAQLPPLPEEFRDGTLGVHFQFEFTP